MSIPDSSESTNPASSRTPYYCPDGDNVLCEYPYRGGGLNGTRQCIKGLAYVDKRVGAGVEERRAGSVGSAGQARVVTCLWCLKRV